MNEEKLSILTFPQRYEGGRLYYNIMLIPRNINPLTPIETDHPAFADANIVFESHIIDSLDGLPLTSDITQQVEPDVVTPIENYREVWETLKQQIEQSEGISVDDNASNNPEEKAESSFQKYKHIRIRKYLPVSYRKAFNFTKPRSKYTLEDDAYACAIKNKEMDIADTDPHADTISWGKLIAYCLRNPKLAQKAGLIYEVSIPLQDTTYDDGGWIFTTLHPRSEISGLAALTYAARIPALKEVREDDGNRNIFAAVLFPVSDSPANQGGYDQILFEAIQYDDGFAKIVHANQPINQDLLNETDASNPPLKDIGIRLGWDDEQLAIWLNRQLTRQEETTDMEVNSPLGVFSYVIDIRKAGTTDWHSQNLIEANNDLSLGSNVSLLRKDQNIELGIEVHPVAHGNSQKDGFWLPMYYTNWIGKALSIPDKDAEEISMLEYDKVKSFEIERASLTDAEYDDYLRNTNNLIPKRTFHPYRQASDHVVELRYGNQYEFRVRLQDISGGGPTHQAETPTSGQRPIANWHFQRHIAPGPMDILNVQQKFNEQEFDGIDTSTGILNPPKKQIDTSVLENIVDSDRPVLRLKRPLLAYPAVAFTGKYQDVVNKLKAVVGSATSKDIVIGLADPDVSHFKVIVEVKSLEMDNALSKNGKESYIELYTKEFHLDAVANNYEQIYDLEIIYRDIPSLNYNDGFDHGVEANQLLLPTSRNLRMTIVPIIGQEVSNDYADESIVEGKKVILSSFKASKDERKLLSPIGTGFRAFYLQPDALTESPKAIRVDQDSFPTTNILLRRQKQAKYSIELARLAEQLGLHAKGLTLEGKTGKRIQFGCSKEIRHSMAPDSSSITIAENSELFNQWLVTVDFSLLRDWTWSALESDSISIYRQSKNEHDINYGDEVLAGTIRISDTANIQSVLGNEVQRHTSRLLFIDVIDPKKINGEYPEEILVKYSVVANFREEFAHATKDNVITEEMHLPITVIPHQIPKIISAGIALSEYAYDKEKYSYSGSRQRFLWLEFEEPTQNPNDTYFARVLNLAPDPLLCRVTQELLSYENEDMPFNLNEEKIRIIVPGMNNDYAGIGVMQEMIPEATADGKSGNIYILPLPDGLHAESDELFGFFTYEIRVGHKQTSWSTAQGRYGRPLRLNGIQHPAPELICNAFRRKISSKNIKKLVRAKQELVISAPFANAVLNSKNVVAFPPQTSLWYMVYAQVLQADGSSYRNLLIESGPMPYLIKHIQKLGDRKNVVLKEDGTRYGTAVIPLNNIKVKLKLLGLPTNNSISAMAVEMFPLENEWQLSIIPQARGREGGEYLVGKEYVSADKETANPLTDNLGSFRIYRSSPLVAVDDLCCEDC